MGRDKGSLVYPSSGAGSDADQRTVCSRLLEAFCERVFVSIREEQRALAPPGVAVIVDQFENLGPSCGLLSARLHAPDEAWLVLACDFPLATSAAVARLVSSRDPSMGGTAYAHPDGTLEPFFTIWEPAALAALEAERLGHATRLSPRRCLERVGCRRLVASRGDGFLVNVNEPAGA
jgi:molybdopterin-guanine dinucleotide biosynthesis protein A